MRCARSGARASGSLPHQECSRRVPVTAQRVSLMVEMQGEDYVQVLCQVCSRRDDLHAMNVMFEEEGIEGLSVASMTAPS